MVHISRIDGHIYGTRVFFKGDVDLEIGRFGVLALAGASSSNASPSTVTGNLPPAPTVGSFEWISIEFLTSENKPKASRDGLQCQTH